MYLYGPNASVAPEHPDRISSFISSTYRYLPLMQGSGFTQYTSNSTGGVFLDTLPQSGNCAMGGCGDVYSEHKCDASECGCDTPGCDGIPQGVEINPQLAYSNTDCTIQGEECRDWLSFHNCNPSLPPSRMKSMCQ